MAMKPRKHSGVMKHHSLGIIASAILVTWIVAYWHFGPGTHLGSFFGNAIADWAGVVVMIYATKHLYERGSAESRLPKGRLAPILEWLRDHSLTIFLLVTGFAWIAIYLHVDSESKWGQVAGNLVSEWTQTLGLVLLTKRFMEFHSKESK